MYSLPTQMSAHSISLTPYLPGPGILGHLSPELLLAEAAAGAAGTAPFEYYFLHLLRSMAWGKLLPLSEPQFPHL